MTRWSRSARNIDYGTTDGPAFLIPAAGASSRFGFIVVVGADASEVAASLVQRSVAVVVNDEWREGLGSSIRAGIRMLSRESAVLIWLGDQVGVTIADLQVLIAAGDRDRTRVVASRYDGTVGVPAIFPRSEYPRLLQLQGDRGARDLFRGHLQRTTLVRVPNAAIDIDTPPDFERHAPRIGRGVA